MTKKRPLKKVKVACPVVDYAFEDEKGEIVGYVLDNAKLKEKLEYDEKHKKK